MPWYAGVSRDQMDWGPAVDAKKCVGCGVCLNCGKNVFEWKDGKSVVVNRDNCQVGCMTCANLCQGKCISFPPLEDVRRFYREHGMWEKVREAMIAEGKISADEDGRAEVEH